MGNYRILPLIFVFLFGCSTQLPRSPYFSGRSIASEKESCLVLLSRFLGDETQVYSYQSRITFENYQEISKELFDNVRNFLSKNEKIDFYDKFLTYEDILVDGYFRHTFQNTVQHGSEELAKKSPNYDQAITDVIVSAHISQKGVKFEIINPQIKKFPESLKKRFYLNDDVNIPENERVGFKGLGMAYWSVIGDLKHLPENSYVEWSSDGKNVKFTLYLELE